MHPTRFMTIARNTQKLVIFATYTHSLDFRSAFRRGNSISDALWFPYFHVKLAIDCTTWANIQYFKGSMSKPRNLLSLCVCLNIGEVLYAGNTQKPFVIKVVRVKSNIP